MKDSTSNAGGEAAELYKDCLSTAGRRDFRVMSTATLTVLSALKIGNIGASVLTWKSQSQQGRRQPMKYSIVLGAISLVQKSELKAR